MFTKSLTTLKFFFVCALAMGTLLMISAPAQAADAAVAAPLDLDRADTYEAPAVRYRPYLTSRPGTDARERGKKRWKKARSMWRGRSRRRPLLDGPSRVEPVAAQCRRNFQWSQGRDDQSRGRRRVLRLPMVDSTEKPRSKPLQGVHDRQ